MWPLVLWSSLPLGAFLRRALSLRTRLLTYIRTANKFSAKFAFAVRLLLLSV